MKPASAEYKRIMKEPFRSHGYMRITLGVINQEAQADAGMEGDFTWYSNPSNVLNGEEITAEYASLEKDYWRADGTMLFLPEEEGDFTLPQGVITENLNGSVTITFDLVYDIKGFTIDFGKYYPEEFTITAGGVTRTYTNTKGYFSTSDTWFNVSSVVITPTVLDNKRMRIISLLCGEGLLYTNTEIQKVQIDGFNHEVSEKLPTQKLTLTILDKENIYNVDDVNSSINFLETGQSVAVKSGLELDDGSIEWIDMGKFYLTKWSSTRGTMKFNAESRFAFLKDYYSNPTLTSRSLYDEAIAVLTSAGLEADQYVVDEYLQDIMITAPFKRMTQAQALQVIANAGRCILYQNVSGQVILQANFANVIEPEDIVVSVTGATAYSNKETIKVGATAVYADLTEGFWRADGSQLFLPTDSTQYLEDTGYITQEVADANGDFVTVPTITLTLEAGFTYYGLIIYFDGNPPQEIEILTYFEGDLVGDDTITDLVAGRNLIANTFGRFDTMTIRFTKATPNNRVLVNKVTFGDLSDYVLRLFDETKYPVGTKEEKVSEVSVKVYTYEQPDPTKDPQEVKDEVYYSVTVNPTGNPVVYANPLITTQAMAEDVAKWLAFYYANNVCYTVNYRGEPRLDAGDIIFMESEVLGSLQAIIQKSTLTFNGAFGGKLTLRRAVRQMGG